MNLDRQPLAQITEVLRRRGYVLLPRHRPTDTGEAVVADLGEGAHFCLGRPVHRIVVRDRQESPPNTYSGRYGHEAFPWHTDLAHWPLPPRFLVLRCVRGAPGVATRLLDGWDVVNAVGTATLFRALVRPRRPIGGRIPLLRLLSRPTWPTAEPCIIRWDEVYIRPASEAGAQGIARFSEALASCNPTETSLSETGDTLILDNWRILHSRSSIPDGASGRIIERGYLKTIR